MIRALIFDFDFTLGDSADGVVRCANAALRLLGEAEMPRERITPTIGLTLPNTYIALTGRKDERQAQLFAQYFHDEADRVMVASTVFYDGVLDSLRLARQNGLKTAIVTTKHHQRIEQIFAKFGASALIDVIVGVDDVQKAKPHPEGLRRAIEALGLRGEEILYVGDSLVDAQTAENAGAPFAAVLTGTTAREAFAAYPCLKIRESVNDVIREALL